MVDLSSLTSRPVAGCTSTEGVEALSRGFEAYIVPARFTVPGYERRFRAENLDPFSSRIYFHGDEPMAVLLVTRRGWTSRVGAMGVAREARGRGLGRRVLAEAVDDARARGDRRMLLEVFEENAAAVALYTGFGFRTTLRMVGYERAPAAPGAPEATLSPMDPRAFARMVAEEGAPELPWMLHPETLAAYTAPSRAWRMDDAAAALVTETDERMVLHALVVRRKARRRGMGTRLLRALAAAHPGRPWLAPQLMPQDLAPEFWRAAGWTCHPLRHLEMALDLEPPPPA
jgi:ribosomal protein S18 acetylase RimI-like enzyme